MAKTTSNKPNSSSHREAPAERAEILGTRMPRLTKADVAQHRAWLSEWHSPEEVAARVRDVNDIMGSADFFNQGGVGFLRDAWMAAKFGQHRACSCVRLVAVQEQWPDFEARCQNGVVERVECVEADLPDRRRGDEYRCAERRIASGKRNVNHDPVEDWVARADQIPTLLASAITAKVNKHYAYPVSLLVYLNVGEFGIRQIEIEQAMPCAVLDCLPHFQNVWILWKERLYGPWKRTCSTV